MDFPNPSPLKKAVDDLKDIVSRSQGDDHEISHLVKQIEAIVASIETKTNMTIVANAPANTQSPVVPAIPVVPVVQPTIPIV